MRGIIFTVLLVLYIGGMMIDAKIVADYERSVSHVIKQD